MTETWRVGRRNPHNVYRQLGDEPRGMEHTDHDDSLGYFRLSEDAATAVAAVNGASLVAELPEPNHGPRWTDTDAGEVQYRRWWVQGEGRDIDGYDVETFGADVMLGGEKVADPRALALALLAAHAAAEVTT